MLSVTAFLNAVSPKDLILLQTEFLNAVSAKELKFHYTCRPNDDE